MRAISAVTELLVNRTYILRFGHIHITVFVTSAVYEVYCHNRCASLAMRVFIAHAAQLNRITSNDQLLRNGVIHYMSFDIKSMCRRYRCRITGCFSTVCSTR